MGVDADTAEMPVIDPRDSRSAVSDGSPLTGPSRPIHVRLAAIMLVFVGGAIGTFARDELSDVVPAIHGVPAGIFVINCLGAFVLGLLMEALARGGADIGVRRATRLCLGTGFCGGFTTYSTFVIGVDGLFSDTAIGWGVAYSVATVLVGAAASLAGIYLGGRRSRSGRA